MGAKLNELNFVTVETLATQAFQFHRGFIDWDFLNIHIFARSMDDS